jgi:hypothetical protein
VGSFTRRILGIGYPLAMAVEDIDERLRAGNDAGRLQLTGMVGEDGDANATRRRLVDHIHKGKIADLLEA